MTKNLSKNNQNQAIELDDEFNQDLDILDGIVDFEQQMYEQGVEKGSEIGKKEQKKASINEGKKYGKQIGNHLGYYSSIISLFISHKPEYFHNPNSRPSRTVKKLQKLISEADITKCYDQNFEKSMNRIKSEFKKLLSLLKVQSQDDSKQSEFEF